MFSANFPYFEKIKGDLLDNPAVCQPVYPPLIFVTRLMRLSPYILFYMQSMYQRKLGY
jgi:hypothetical protein